MWQSVHILADGKTNHSLPSADMLNAHAINSEKKSNTPEKKTHTHFKTQVTNYILHLNDLHLIRFLGKEKIYTHRIFHNS